ncbi:hypothetical protein L345_02591, partial [Ophiophagus hannah]
MSVSSKKDLGGSRKAVVYLIDSCRQGVGQKAAETNRQQMYFYSSSKLSSLPWYFGEEACTCAAGVGYHSLGTRNESVECFAATEREKSALRSLLMSTREAWPMDTLGSHQIALHFQGDSIPTTNQEKVVQTVKWKKLSMLGKKCNEDECKYSEMISRGRKQII